MIVMRAFLASARTRELDYEVLSNSIDDSMSLKSMQNCPLQRIEISGTKICLLGYKSTTKTSLSKGQKQTNKQTWCVGPLESSIECLRWASSTRALFECYFNHEQQQISSCLDWMFQEVSIKWHLKRAPNLHFHWLALFGLIFSSGGKRISLTKERRRWKNIKTSRCKFVV